MLPSTCLLLLEQIDLLTKEIHKKDQIIASLEAKKRKDVRVYELTGSSIEIGLWRFSLQINSESFVQAAIVFNRYLFLEIDYTTNWYWFSVKNNLGETNYYKSHVKNSRPVMELLSPDEVSKLKISSD